MSAWEKIAANDTPEDAISIGDEAEAFIQKKVKNVDALAVLFFLVDLGLDSCKAAAISKEAELDKDAVTTGLTQLEEAGLVGGKRGLLGKTWSYLPKNKDSIMVYNLHKFWRHARTRLLFSSHIEELLAA